MDTPTRKPRNIRPKPCAGCGAPYRLYALQKRCPPCQKLYLRERAAEPGPKQKRDAQRAVKREIAAGRLVRQPCEKCGATPAHGHHEDYSKPLEVRWLCQTHHAERHLEIKHAVWRREFDRKWQEKMTGKLAEFDRLMARLKAA